VEATVIGIDFGTHWFKVSIIKPGGSVETVLNRESKRKTSNIITLNKGVRNFGTDAEQLSAKLPKDTFYSLKNLLGKTYDSVAEYRETFPNVMIASERNTCNFTTLGSSYSTEELVANLLAHAVRQATSYAGVGVTGAVITVPPYFSHFERRALLDAADIANLRVYGLVNDETAVAIKYALGKSFEQKEHHIFYDMGAGSTIASLVEFHSGFDKKISKKVIDLHVKATGYDATLGGQAVDVILQNFLASQFQKIHKTDLSSNTRAMARLLKEANRVKTILSANQDVMSSVKVSNTGRKHS
jgi:hypoxia up-regulated 1